MPTEKEIRDDIANIYRKIDQCYLSKTDLQKNIEQQQLEITSLGIYMKEDEIRVFGGKKARYERESMLENINRCKDNIKLFLATIDRESENVAKFLHIIEILQEDLKRPNEIVFDASTGQVISDSTK